MEINEANYSGGAGLAWLGLRKEIDSHSIRKLIVRNERRSEPRVSDSLASGNI